MSIERELKEEQAKLTERIKELECLYRISKLTSQKRYSFEETMQKITRTVPSAFRHPNRTCVRISIDDASYTTSLFMETKCRINQEIGVFGKPRGGIEIYYKETTNDTCPPFFLQEERKLLRSTAELLGVMLEKRHQERVMKKLTSDLQNQKKDLEKKNITLKEVLAQIELEKREMKENIRATVSKTIFPVLQKLRTENLRERERDMYVEMITQELEDLYSPFIHRITDRTLNLSPREIEISNMIKNGFTNKQTATALHLSVLTVERHRHNIRKKLGISNRKINLTTYLRGLQ